MDSVGVDCFRKVSANGARSGFFRVGSTHQLTVFSDGAFAFQHLYHYRARVMKPAGL